MSCQMYHHVIGQISKKVVRENHPTLFIIIKWWIKNHQRHYVPFNKAWLCFSGYFFSQKQCKCRIITLQDEVALKHIKLLNKHEGTYSQSETHRHKKRLMCIFVFDIKAQNCFCMFFNRSIVSILFVR